MSHVKSPTEARVDLQMTTRPGYTGQLTDKMLERVHFIATQLDMPHLPGKFTHLTETHGEWRAQHAVITEETNLAEYIDHTVLKPDAPDAAIEQLCADATAHHFKAVCVNGCHVTRCAELLAGSSVRVACVCGFPLGQMTTNMKVAEATEEIASGAKEVDMVINIGALKSKRYRDVFADIKEVCDVCAASNVTSKVILETCLLSHDEIMDACIMSVAAGATYVKTSTGFSSDGATPEVVDIMLAMVGNLALVKASGGVRDRATALQYAQAGVRRIGTSAGIAIVS